MPPLEAYASQIIKEFDGTSGLALIFLFGLSTHLQEPYLTLFTVGSFVFFGISRGVLKSLMNETNSSELESQFRELGNMLLDKRKERLPDRLQFLGIMISGFAMLIIEVSVILIGIISLFKSGIIVNRLLTLIWMIFLYKFIEGWADAYTTDSFREFVVKFNKEMPGKTFWKSSEK